jgi:hypothetical protein
MVNFNIAYTSRINPVGATPVLNQAQIWAGLQRKIRFAQEFVPVIESCEVKFKKGMGPKDEAKEVVRGYWPSWVRRECLQSLDVQSKRDLMRHPEGEESGLTL